MPVSQPATLIHQQSTTTGTGNFTLSTVGGKQGFSTAFGTGATTNVFDYFISNQSAGEWERGTGHMSDATTLVRDTVIESTNSNTAVSFSAGTKDVCNDMPAGDQVRQNWLRGYIDGLITSRNGTTPNTKIDVSAGVAMDSTNAVMISSSSTLTIDTAGTGANGLDAGTLAASTWYHVYIIQKADRTVAALASTSASAPTMPSGYSYKRRIGSVRTDASVHFLAYVQVGDEFIWAAPIVDKNGVAVPTTATLFALTVPTGVQIWARLRGAMVAGASSSNTMLFQSPDETSAIAGATVGNADVAATNTTAVLNSQFNIIVRTDTSAQVRWSASAASGTGYVTTFGWFDQRGKNA